MINVALFHAPMLNKNQEEIITSITNIDIHDIARSSTTYGVERYFIVHPLTIQQEIAGRIAGHWKRHSQRDYNLSRSDAFRIIEFVKDMEDLKSRLNDFTFVATSARQTQSLPGISYGELREKIASQNILLGFGTGHGMTEGLLKGFDYVLDPINGPTPYNHLSVRSACAITLDRLLGKFS